MTAKRMMQSRWPKQPGDDTVAMEDIQSAQTLTTLDAVSIAHITISPTDHLIVMVDAAPTAHATIMGNYIADRLGIPRDRVTVVAGGRHIHTVNVESQP
jgi:CO/xanthine dehydrogenase Mo-binding subunit